MSKWTKLLQEEIEKSKSTVNQQLSVLSVASGGLLEKNNGVLDHKIAKPCFEPMSVLSVPSGGLLEKKEERKSVINQQLSALSVPYRGISVKSNNIENITDNPYIPTDNTDIGPFVGKKYQIVDFTDSFCASDIKNICNNPQTPTDNTDIGSFPRKNPHLVDFPISFADAIEIIATRNRPKDIRKPRWIAIVKRLSALVRDEKRHLLKMIEYGWPPEEVFGCHKFAPDARIDGMGLLMLLGNSTIAEVHPERALLKSRSGSMLSYYLGAMNRNLSERITLMEIE